MQARYLQCVRGTWLARYAGMPPTFLFAAPTGGDSYLAPRAIHITPLPLPHFHTSTFSSPVHADSAFSRRRQRAHIPIQASTIEHSDFSQLVLRHQDLSVRPVQVRMHSNLSGRIGSADVVRGSCLCSVVESRGAGLVGV
jgi:hypothetical protein